MVGDIEFRDNLTEGSSIEGKKKRTQYGTLGDTKGEKNSLGETITYFDFLFSVREVGFDPQ